MRCGACCFLRGICVLRECSIIRAASSSPRLRLRSVGPQEKESSDRKHQGKVSFRQSSRGIIPPGNKSRHLFRLRTSRHVSHYFIVITDDPLVVVSDAIFAIIAVILREKVSRHLCTPCIRGSVRTEPIARRRSDDAPVSNQIVAKCSEEPATLLPLTPARSSVSASPYSEPIDVDDFARRRVGDFDFLSSLHSSPL